MLWLRLLFLISHPITSKIKISIVNYTNTLPFRWALKHSNLNSEIELQEDVPSTCAEKLKNGEVQLALVPVALPAALDSYKIETEYCIGADGIVDSVKLYSNVPLEKIKEVFLDYQSRTSIALARILFAHYWKSEVKFIDAKPGFENNITGSSAAVVIGDRTFAMNGRYLYEFDLAGQWKKFTGLPFVFAAWVTRQPLPAKFIAEFNTTLKYGVDNILKAVAEEGPPPLLDAKQTVDYLENRIDYVLDESKLRALEIFLSYIKED